MTSSTTSSYEVFSPFFNHQNKETSNYVAQSAGSQPLTNSKPNSPAESDISSLRNNYTTPEQNEVRILSNIKFYSYFKINYFFLT